MKMAMTITSIMNVQSVTCTLAWILRKLLSVHSVFDCASNVGKFSGLGQGGCYEHACVFCCSVIVRNRLWATYIPARPTKEPPSTTAAVPSARSVVGDDSKSILTR